jgi:hypothetical protein
MHSAYESFRDCGWAAWLCLLIGLAGAAAGVLGVALFAGKVRGAARVFGILALAAGVLSLGTGLVGRETGLSRTRAAVSGESIDPSQRARILALGAEEANQCIAVGAATGALPFILGALAVGLGLALQKEAAG